MSRGALANCDEEDGALAGCIVMRALPHKLVGGDVVGARRGGEIFYVHPISEGSSAS